jgi:hypothetical protein
LNILNMMNNQTLHKKSKISTIKIQKKYMRTTPNNVSFFLTGRHAPSQGAASILSHLSASAWSTAMPNQITTTPQSAIRAQCLACS